MKPGSDCFGKSVKYFRYINCRPVMWSNGFRVYLSSRYRADFFFINFQELSSDANEIQDVLGYKRDKEDGHHQNKMIMA